MKKIIVMLAFAAFAVSMTAQPVSMQEASKNTAPKVSQDKGKDKDDGKHEGEHHKHRRHHHEHREGGKK